MKLLIATLCVFATIALTLGNRGPIRQRIAGGQRAAKKQFPFIVSIAVKHRQTCGGAIIAKRWVLTAAHCINHLNISRVTIKAGITNRADKGKKFKIDQAIMYDEVWDSHSYINDIGLLKLDKDIKYTESIQPVRISKKHVNPGTTVILAGWGRSSEDAPCELDLQWITLNTISKEECQASLVHKVTDDMLCTATKVGEGFCTGDSGSPLIYNDKIVGLTSWGKKCGSGYPNVFNRVSLFSDWVQDVVKNN